MTTFKKLLIIFILICIHALNTHAYSKIAEINNAINTTEQELKSTNNERQKVELLNKLSRLVTQLGNCESSKKYAHEAEKIASKIDYQKGLTSTYATLCAIYRDCGEYKKSITYSKISLERLKEKKNLVDEAFVYDQLGCWYWENLDTIQGLKYHYKALTIRETLDRTWLTHSYDKIAEILAKQGKYEEAISYYKKSNKIYEDENRLSHSAWTLGNIGLMYRWKGNSSQALSYFFKSISKYEEDEWADGIIWMQENISSVYKELLQFDKALQYELDNLKLAKKENDFIKIAETNILLGETYFLKNEINTSLSYYKKALDIFIKHNNRKGISDVYFQRGSNYYKLKKFKLALIDLEEAYEAAKTIKSKRRMAEINTMLGAIQLALLDYKNARTNLQLALNYFQSTNATGNFPFIYKQLTTLDSIEGNFHSALNNHQLSEKYNFDKRLSQKETEKIAMRFEFEKQQAIAEEKLKNRTLQINATITALVFSIIILLSIIYSVRLRTKKIAIEKENINLTKREIDRVLETEQFKSRFLINISHEFRTPLTLINTHIELLLSEGRNEDKLRFKEIQNSGNQLLDLINQLLELSKMESSTYQLRYQFNDITSIIQNLFVSFQTLAANKNINLEVEQLYPNQTFLNLSSETVTIIVSNLLSNAIKFTPENGTIILRTSIINDMFQIEVTDTGIGISDLHAEKIFDRFYQIDSPSQRTFEGSGIGLALVKELALIHGGDVKLNSENQIGCQFIVELKCPIIENQGVNTIITHHEITEWKDSDSYQQLESQELELILIVEDHEKLRKLLIEILGPNYRYLEANNGKEGIELAEEFLPDLIISDVMMPDIDGLSLCNKLKSEYSTSHIPIIMLTAKSNLDSKLEGLEIGAEDYITKPFSIEEIKIKVKNILHSREVLRNYYMENRIRKVEHHLELNKMDKEFIDKLESIIEIHLSDKQFGVVELSDHLFFSVSKLTRKLKSVTGRTPAEYIRTMRLEHSIQLMKEGYNVTEAAMKVSFDDPIYFSKIFKKQFGYPPSLILKEKI